ncbi:putative metal ion transporter [Cystobasidium minutum MCA 4210]|uniref:putative metal ion transporter n=1 Tax=Cystobasidium minutum MCA 4210 TaxID=1397322 RepID=UPI0034CF109C|eukprot:jgi/Rhomi1/153947/estExt_Genewise1.C_5_t10439
MSFGKPPNFTNFAVSAPDRGSFPLDHEGECKQFMTAYLKCLKSNKNDNGKCRHLTKEYLKCRMEHGLMEKDSWENLGLQGVEDGNTPSSETSSTTTSKPKNKHPVNQ